MSADTALTKSVETRTHARSGTHAAELAPHAELAPDSADDGGRTVSDLGPLVDGMLRTLEEQRARVATVLADDVVPVVTLVRYLIDEAAQCVARGDLEETAQSLRNASARMRDAVQQLAVLSWELRPRVLDDLGLVAALTEYIRDFSRQNRTIVLSPRITVGEDNVPAQLKLIVFRIVQEALSNVVAHSKASAARVLLSQFEDELRLVIEDNGIGFDVERWRNRRLANDGCGLGMIQRWAGTSGGHSAFKAVPRHGTRVQVVWLLCAPGETPLEDATADAPSASTSV